MDHPNIAKVLDAGTTPAGRPYFVMELIRGIPITHYRDRRRLTPRERLGLIVTVCQAIQHAHQKGIIHWDIKPSSVLVTSHDGKPVANPEHPTYREYYRKHLIEKVRGIAHLRPRAPELGWLHGRLGSGSPWRKFAPDNS